MKPKRKKAKRKKARRTSARYGLTPTGVAFLCGAESERARIVAYLRAAAADEAAAIVAARSPVVAAVLAVATAIVLGLADRIESRAGKL